MKYLILTTVYMSITQSSFAAEKSCKYGESSSCPPDYHCVHYEKDKDICIKSFSGDRIIVTYPFNKKTKFICDQGHLSAKGNSHTWNNTAFALDLQGDRTIKKNSVFAGVNGTIVAFDGCKTKNDQCGLGFGNQVKILTEDNFIVFYAHMQKVSVKTGDKVQIGSSIGIEGETGWTGKDNRHLHLSVHYDWKTAGFEYWKNTGYLPPSVPFALLGMNGEEVKSEKISCNR